MSKWSTFLKIASTVGAQALLFTPLAPIAMPVALAIAEAQKIEGASGADKLAHVTAIALSAAQAVNVEAGHQVIDPAVVLATAKDSISATVGVIKIVHDAHTPAAL